MQYRDVIFELNWSMYMFWRIYFCFFLILVLQTSIQSHAYLLLEIDLFYKALIICEMRKMKRNELLSP